jgi:hypothetical protein
MHLYDILCNFVDFCIFIYFYVFSYPRGGPQTRTGSPIRTRNPRGLPILQPSPHRCGAVRVDNPKANRLRDGMVDAAYLLGMLIMV